MCRSLKEVINLRAEQDEGKGGRVVKSNMAEVG